MKLDNDTIDALVSLIDDPDPCVHVAVVERLTAMGPDVVAQVKERTQTIPQAMQLLWEVEQQFLRRQLETWLSLPDGDMLEGISLVQRYLGLDDRFDLMDRALMEGVTEVCALLADYKTLLEKVQLFNKVFFNTMHFITLDPFLKKLNKANMTRVLLNKVGNPVSVGIAYLMLAQRSGVPIHGVLFQGGFMPAVIDKQGQSVFYVNLYRDGLLFAPSQLDKYFKRSGITIPPESFRRANPGNLVQIYLESLFFIYTQDQTADKKKELWIEQLLPLFGPNRLLIMEEDEED